MRFVGNIHKTLQYGHCLYSSFSASQRLKRQQSHNFSKDKNGMRKCSGNFGGIRENKQGAKAISLFDSVSLVRYFMIKIVIGVSVGI